METVLQRSLPVAPWADPRTRRLPGTLPLDPQDWLQTDEAYAGQMALRDRLIAERPDAVHALLPGAEAAAAELYGRVVAEELPRLGIAVAGGLARRPDGVTVTLDPGRPLLTLGRLVQEDFCIMERRGADFVLTAAILCFPAGWTLAEKIGRPLTGIHAPVSKYTDDVARRVQRLFDAIRPDQPLWRANGHRSGAPLFNPLEEASGLLPRPDGPLPFVRSERQCLVRLPRSQAVVFSIHTWLVAKESLTAEQAAALAAHPIHSAR